MKNEADFQRELESYKEALKLKEEGNEVFKKGNLKLALRSYTRMLIHLGMKATFSMSSLGIGGGAINRTEEKDDEDTLKKLRKDADLLRKTCFNNISAVYARIGDWEKSLEKAQKVLEMDDKNQKALFRCGVAYKNLREYEKAKESLVNAQKVGNTASIRNELRRVEAAVSAQRAKDDKRLRRAFKKAKTAEAKASSQTKEGADKPVEQKEGVKEAMDEDEVTGEEKGPSTDASEKKEKDSPGNSNVAAGSPSCGEAETSI